MMTEVLSSYTRLRWACRRGMLELDLTLLPFFEQKFNTLSLQEQKDFETFLAQADQDLYAWLLGFQPCDEPRFVGLIEKIRAHASSKL